MRRQQHQRRNWSQITLWVLLALILVLGSTFIVFHEALRPGKTAASQTIQIAQKAGVTGGTDFLTYNRQQTYYSVSGKNRKQQAVYAIVAKKSGHVTTVKQSQGKTKTAILRQAWQKVKPQKVLNIGLGLKANQPVWEVTYLNAKGDLCYNLYDYHNGNTVQSIQNL
ncbi:DUF5590 domain-containing protein [Furfurilactobacillus sp. WILCCON 0119]